MNAIKKYSGMVRIWGQSDDLVEIEGSRYYENEIDCYERDVVLFFEDGTIARIGYHKPNGAIWYIKIERHGNADYVLTECHDEDADVYSDVLEIASEVIHHRVIRQDEEVPPFFEIGQYVVYVNKDKCEVGRIKRLAWNGAFVCYSSGDTAALTSYEYLFRIDNTEVLEHTVLGGK